MVSSPMEASCLQQFQVGKKGKYNIQVLKLLTSE
jgi:hypothetical protein